jgi:hypothetical protein
MTSRPKCFPKPELATVDAVPGESAASCSRVELPGELASDGPAAAGLLDACACSSWPLSSFTRPSRDRSLSISWSTAGAAWATGTAGVDEAALLVVARSRRRAQRGGRSLAGNTQAIFARRQLEHGDSLSQRTLRLRQTTQLRSFGVHAVEGGNGEVGALAFSSAAEAAEAGLSSGPGGWDILVSASNSAPEINQPDKLLFLEWLEPSPYPL